MKVLIVDDSKPIVSFVKNMLIEAKYECEAVYDGRQAMDILKEKGGEFDIILLDWNMPVLDGEGVLEELKNQANILHGHIIMMTTENKPEKIQKAISLGVKEYIMKPFSSEILIGKINMVMENEA